MARNRRIWSHLPLYKNLLSNTTGTFIAYTIFDVPDDHEYGYVLHNLRITYRLQNYIDAETNPANDAYSAMVFGFVKWPYGASDPDTSTLTIGESGKIFNRHHIGVTGPFPSSRTAYTKKVSVKPGETLLMVGAHTVQSAMDVDVRGLALGSVDYTRA